MLVLALEFSRGCTAHAGVGSPPLDEQAVRNGNKPPDRGTHGVSGRRRRDGQEEQPGTRGARRGLDSEVQAGTATRRRDVTGIDPKGRSLKTE